MSNLDVQNDEPMFPSIITTLDTYLESVSDDKAFQAMDEVKSGKAKKKKVKKSSKNANLSPVHLADVKAVPPAQRPSSRKGMDELASPRKLKALATYPADGEHEFHFAKDSSLFSSNSPPHAPQRTKVPPMDVPPKPSPRPNARKYKVAEHQSGNQYEAPRSASPTVLQSYGQDLGFGKAVETIAAMKLHNFAMKRRDHVSQKLKLLKEIRGFERENKEELIVAQKYRNKEFLAAWKLRYYIEYMRLNAMRHIVDVVEAKNIELENEAATLQQTLTESRQFNTEVNNRLEETTDELQKATGRISQLNENIHHLSSNLAHTQQELAQSRAEIAEMKQIKENDDLTLLGHLQAIESLKAELGMTRSTCQDVIRSSVMRDEELDRLRARLSMLQISHETTVHELSFTKATRGEEAENALMREEDSQIKAIRLNQLNQEIDDKSAMIKTCQTQIASYEAQIEQLNGALASANAEIQTEKDKVSESELQKASLSKLLTDLAVKVTKLENDAASVQKVVADLEKKTKKSKDKIKEQTAQIDTMETQITTSQQEIDFLADENEELAREIECHSMYTEDIEARYQRVVELNARSVEYSRFLEEELFNARKLYKSKIDEGGDRIEISDESYNYNGKNTRGKSAGAVEFDDEDLDRETDVQSVPRSPQQPDTLLPSIILQLQSFHSSPNGRVTFNRTDGISKPGSRPTTNPFLLSHFINQENGGTGPSSPERVGSAPVPSTASVLEQKFMSLVKNLEDKLKTVDTVAESLRAVAMRAEAFEASMSQMGQGSLSANANPGTFRGFSSAGPRKVVTYSDEMSPEEVEQLQQKELYINQHLNMENFFNEIMNSLEQVLQELDLQKEEIQRMNDAKSEVKSQISAWRKKFKKATGFEPSEEDKLDHCGDLLNDFNKLKDALNEMKNENNLLAGKANELQTELYNLNNDLELSGDEFYRLYNEPIADYLPEMMVPQQPPEPQQREMWQFSAEEDEPFSRNNTPGTGMSSSRKTPRSNSVGFGGGFEETNVGESGMLEEHSLDRPSVEDSVNSDESSSVTNTKKKKKSKKEKKDKKHKKSKSKKASASESEDDNESIALSEPSSPTKRSSVAVPADLNLILQKAVAETAALFQDSGSMVNGTILEGSVEMTTAELNSVALSDSVTGHQRPYFRDLSSFASYASADMIPAGSPVQDVMEQASLSAEMSMHNALDVINTDVMGAGATAAAAAAAAAMPSNPVVSVPAAVVQPAATEEIHFNSLASSIVLDETEAPAVSAAVEPVVVVQPKPLMVETGTSYTPQEGSIILSEHVTPEKKDAPVGSNTFTEGIAMAEVNNVLDSINASSPLAHMYPNKKASGGVSPDSLASPLKTVGQGSAFKNAAAAGSGIKGGLNSSTHLERKQAQLAKQQAREAVTKLKGEIEQNLSDIESMSEDVALMQATRAEIRLEIVRWIFNFNELCGYHPENIDKIRSRTFQTFVETFVEMQNAIQKTCDDINNLIDATAAALKQLVEAQEHALQLGAVKVAEDFQSFYVLPEQAQFESEDPFVILPESENGVFIAPTAPLVQYDESKVVRKASQSVSTVLEEEMSAASASLELLNTSADSIPLDTLSRLDEEQEEALEQLSGDKFEEFRRLSLKPLPPVGPAPNFTTARKVSSFNVSSVAAMVEEPAPVYNNRKNLKLSTVKYTYVLPSLVNLSGSGGKAGPAPPLVPKAAAASSAAAPVLGPLKTKAPLPAVASPAAPPAVSKQPSASPPVERVVAAAVPEPVLTKSPSREAYELWRKQVYEPSIAAAAAAAASAPVASVPAPSYAAEPKIDSNRSVTSYGSKHDDSPLPESKKHMVRNMFEDDDDRSDRRVFDHKSDELRQAAPPAPAAPPSSVTASPGYKSEGRGGGGSAKMQQFDQYEHKRSDAKGVSPAKTRTNSDDSVKRNLADLPPLTQHQKTPPQPVAATTADAVEGNREPANSLDDNNSMISDFKYQQPLFEMMEPEDADEFDYDPYQGLEDYAPSEGAAGGGGDVKTPSFFSQPVTPGDNLFVDDPYEFDMTGKQPPAMSSQSREQSFKNAEIARVSSKEEKAQQSVTKQKAGSDDFSKYFNRDDEDEEVDPKLDSGKKADSVTAAVPETTEAPVEEPTVQQEPSHVSLAMPTAEEVVELKKEYASIKKVLKKWKAAFVKQYGTEPTMADADEMDVEIMRKLERKDELKEILEAYKQSMEAAGGGGGEDADNEFTYSRPTTAGGLTSRPHTAPDLDDMPGGVDPTEYHNALVANMTTPFAARGASPSSVKAAPTPPAPAAPKYSADQIAAMNSEYSALKKDLKKWKANFVKTVGCEPTMDDFANLDIETMTKISRKEELREILDNWKYGADGSATGPGAVSESEGYSSPTFAPPPAAMKNIAAPAFKNSSNALSQEEVEASMAQQTQALVTPIRPDESLDELQSEYNKLKKALRKWKATFVAKYQRDPTTNDFEELDIDVKRQIARKNQLKAYLDEHNASDDEE